MAALANKMKCRYLGNLELVVSRLALGTMTFDTPMDFDKSYETMTHTFKHGINFFDNAETYSNGQAEVIADQAIKKGIERGVWPRTFGPNDNGLSLKKIIEDTRAALKRNGQEYVDLIFCHSQDPRTPIEENVRTMNFVIDQDWGFYWGTSKWNAHDVMEACEIADRLGMARPVMGQPEYSIFERLRVDYGFVNLYQKYKYGLTTSSSLASGILTDKHFKGIPEGSRFSASKFRDLMDMNEVEKRITKVDKLAEAADEVGATLAQFSTAWCTANEHVSSIILGATSTKQIGENIKAMAFVDKITPEIRAKVDDIVQSKPVVLPSAKSFMHQLRERYC